jgi:hypothetical protein
MGRPGGGIIVVIAIPLAVVSVLNGRGTSGAAYAAGRYVCQQQ